MTPALIGVDWGTTSLRGYLMAGDGAVLDRRDAPLGITKVADGRFEAALAELSAPWTAAHGALPFLLSGMIGSRQGWKEAPYVSCPAGLETIAAGLMPVSVAGQSIHIVPGVDTRDAGGRPDVMRGEETQIFGAMAAMGLSSGLFVLPGTHSKWVRAEGGRIASFRTYMTGEVYAVLRQHSILGRLMEGESGDGSGFRAGVLAALELDASGDLLNRFFSVRAMGLLGDLKDSESADYLSGLLIGAEISAAARGVSEPVVVIGDAGLCQRYRDAAGVIGIQSTSAPADIAALGQFMIARSAGLLDGRAAI